MFGGFGADFPVLREFANVRRLFKPTGGWDVELIRNSFNEGDADAILSLPMGRNQGQETTLHALWGCRNLKVVSENWVPMAGSSGGNQVQMFDFLVNWFVKWDADIVGLFCVVLWRVWFNRYQVTHGPWQGWVGSTGGGGVGRKLSRRVQIGKPGTWSPISSLV
ncbi:hypothetical protein QYF36_010179 [Acer negundo]|nr:hypothetical protein QYF36_010179 [Acer negundo]